MTNTVFFLHYRAGSTIFQNYISSKKNTEAFLPTTPPKQCNVIHTNCGNILELSACGRERPVFITTHMGNWWGNLSSDKVPGPYEDPSPMKWDVSELKKFNLNHWKFGTLMRDGRNVVSSLINLKHGIEEKFVKADRWDYFKSLCLGFRNQARVALDNANELENYKIFKFEDLIANPVDTLTKIYNYTGHTPDTSHILSSASDVKNRTIGPNHSSFKDDKKMNLRWSSWSEEEKDFFYKVAGKELTELGYE